MAKRKKINWFWNAQTEDEATLFPNTAKQRAEKKYNKDGNEIMTPKQVLDADEDEYYYGYYQPDDWGRSWRDSKKKTQASQWDDYKKTGVWKGYSTPKSATLSYSYIQQMANAIAAEHNVKVQVGRDWEVDLHKKILTYNPTTMMFGSKGELLATLLHEVGKIKLCTPLQGLQSKWYKEEWKKFAYQATIVFDDFRVDDVMIKSYPSADEVYQSQEATLLRVVEMYDKLADTYREVVRNVLQHKTNQLMEYMNDGHDFQTSYTAVYRCPPPPHMTGKTAYLAEQQKAISGHQTNIYDYVGVMIYKGYGLKDTAVKTSKEQEDLFDKTKGGIPKAIKESSTQGVLDMMDTEVFPHIEHLLESMSNGSDAMKQAMGNGAAKGIMQDVNNNMQGHEGNPDLDDGNNNNTKIKSRGQLPGTDQLPKEWVDGDYASLKDSVQAEIASLTRKLTTIRRKENIIRFENNHRRGKLNSKVLYRHRLGSNRLFKKKMQNVDTVRSFVFSILVDISGSMYDGGYGNKVRKAKIVHTIRGVIMLSEVFTKLDMPFEVIFFTEHAQIVKKFDDKYDKKVKGRVSGVINESGGGTRLAAGLAASTIEKREELNRVCVVLTDGLCEPNQVLDEKYFRPFAKKNIKSIVMGLECGDEIKGLNMGQGRRVDNSAQMPEEFYNVLKTTVLKK
jgi:hypothetical protein